MIPTAPACLIASTSIGVDGPEVTAVARGGVRFEGHRD